MNSKQFHEKLLNVKKELKSAIQTEFNKTNLEKIGFEWKTPALKYNFPVTDPQDSIKTITDKGAVFDALGFLPWNKFSNFFDLVKILEYLELFNSFLNSDQGPVTWDIAKIKKYVDPSDVTDPKRYLWSPMIDEEGNEIYFPACKLKKIKNGNKNLNINDFN